MNGFQFNRTTSPWENVKGKTTFRVQNCFSFPWNLIMNKTLIGQHLLMDWMEWCANWMSDLQIFVLCPHVYNNNWSQLPLLLDLDSLWILTTTVSRKQYQRRWEECTLINSTYSPMCSEWVTILYIPQVGDAQRPRSRFGRRFRPRSRSLPRPWPRLRPVGRP